MRFAVRSILSFRNGLPPAAGGGENAERYRQPHPIAEGGGPAGERALSSSALYYQPVDAAERWDSDDLVETVGGYGFYSSNGRI